MFDKLLADHLNKFFQKDMSNIKKGEQLLFGSFMSKTDDNNVD